MLYAVSATILQYYMANTAMYTHKQWPPTRRDIMDQNAKKHMWEKLLCFHNPIVDFIKFPQYFIAILGKNNPLLMIEVSDILSVVPFIYL